MNIMSNITNPNFLFIKARLVSCSQEQVSTGWDGCFLCGGMWNVFMAILWKEVHTLGNTPYYISCWLNIQDRHGTPKPSYTKTARYAWQQIHSSLGYDDKQQH